MKKPRRAGLEYETDIGLLTSSQRRWIYWGGGSYRRHKRSGYFHPGCICCLWGYIF